VRSWRLGLPEAAFVPGIFINYRSNDDSYAAPLLDDRLRAVFGDENVFKDSRSIDAGTDFPPELWRRLLSSQVLLVLIGPRWLTVTDTDGRRRLDHPEDYVRREIETALAARTQVIPVLLDGARLPSVAELPATVHALSTRQVMHLRQREAGIDLPAIVTELSKWVPPKVPTPATKRRAGGVHFERGGVYIETFNGTGDIVSGDKNVYGGMS
jgi:hypothetical protein